MVVTGCILCVTGSVVSKSGYNVALRDGVYFRGLIFCIGSEILRFGSSGTWRVAGLLSLVAVLLSCKFVSKNIKFVGIYLIF